MADKRDDRQAGDLPPTLEAPALRAPDGARYHRLEDLTGVTEAEILRLPGFGPRPRSPTVAWPLRL
jgi:hypothetical protein